MKDSVDSSKDAWEALCAQAKTVAASEELLRPQIEAFILSQPDLGAAVRAVLAARLCGCPPDADRAALHAIFDSSLPDGEGFAEGVARDLRAVVKIDPAAKDDVTPFLFFKGFHALQTHRHAHVLWRAGRTHLACLLQSLSARVFAVDIHPAARIGYGVTLDHATGIVIGETAVVGDDVLILHNVTLGTRGYETGDRHPIIGSNVTLGAGAKVLGRITVGDGAYVAASSLVTKPVSAGETVAGVPAKPMESKKLKD